MPQPWAAFMALVVAMLGQPSLAGAQQGWSDSVDTVSPVVAGTGHPVSNPHVDVDAAGNAIAVWSVESATHAVVQAVHYSAAKGRWGPAQLLSANPGSTSTAQVAVDAAGTAIAVWSERPSMFYPPKGSYRILAARYSADTRTWGPPANLSGPDDSSHPENVLIGMDAAGNAVAVWREYTIPPSGNWVRASRYTTSAGTWTPATTVAFSMGSLNSPQLAVGETGEAFAIWIAIPPLSPALGGTVQAARYDSLTGAWSAPANVSAAGEECLAPDIGVDAHGNAIAAWNLRVSNASSSTQAARYSAAKGAWGSAVTLSFPGQGGGPRVAVAPQGDAVAVWATLLGGSVLQAARYRSATEDWRRWSTIVPAGGPEVATDAAGNATAVWVDADQIARAMRNTVPGESWGSPVTLSPPGTRIDAVAVAAAPSGTVATVWRARVSGYAAIQGTHWLATPAAPAVTAVEAGAGAISVPFAQPLTTESLFAPTNHAYSLDDGATWTERDPASTTSPLGVAGLSDGVPYTFRLRAINRAGSRLPSSPVGVRSGIGSNSPSGLVATSIDANRVTIAWTPPDVGLVPASYVVEGGINPGETLASIPTGSTAPTFTFAAPAGAFYLRVRAATQDARSLPSNEILIFVNVPAPPSAPANLLGLVDASSVALSWVNTYAGGAPTSLWLNVTGAITTRLPLPFGETFTLAGVPAGTYTLSVSAANAIFMSPPSNAVTLTFPGPCSGAPSVPATFQAWNVGATISVAWSPPASGPAVTGYTVLVSGTRTASITTTGRSLSGTVGPGSYTLSVAATNPCGTGPPTPPQAVVIP
jgi:hypothetical protein